jgi:hypothetical protein
MAILAIYQSAGVEGSLHSSSDALVVGRDDTEGGCFKNLFLILSQTAKRKPKSSRPTNINQEPGVNGVISAKKPITIKIIPTIFFAGWLPPDIFLYQVFKSGMALTIYCLYHRLCDFELI